MSETPVSYEQTPKPPAAQPLPVCEIMSGVYKVTGCPCGLPHYLTSVVSPIGMCGNPLILKPSAAEQAE